MDNMNNSSNRTNRRLLILKGTALGSLAASLPGKRAEAAAGVAPPAGTPDNIHQVQRATDSDPRDAAGSGRGRANTTDSDPRDGAGAGRGAARRVTDSDPRDGAGTGRGSSGRATNDTDPNDRGGMGRGGRGATDNDPRDGAGQGRGR